MPTYKYLDGTGLERTLSKLKTYIDSQSGGGSDGHGFIICDTSTMQVGDRIRVRSVYTVLEEPYNQTKEVVTVGQPVTFTVPCYDYYKICTVQDIGGVATEVGGVYKTVDYGQTYFIDVIDKSSLGGIQGILNAHQETSLLAIGDEVNTIVDGNSYTVEIAKIDGNSHYVEFVSKKTTEDVVSIINSNYSLRTAVLNTLSSFYSSIIEKDKNLIKDKVVNYNFSTSAYTITQKVWLPTRIETMGTGSEIGSQFPLFATQANRIRYDSNGSAQYYMLAGCTQTASAGYADCITSAGNLTNTTTALRLLPCFRLTADS